MFSGTIRDPGLQPLIVQFAVHYGISQYPGRAHPNLSFGASKSTDIIADITNCSPTALQLGQDANSPYELRSQRCQMCLRSDSLHKVMERLANPGVRRLVIVEAGSKRVEGIVSLGDIFKFLLA
ncbi:hypothetical protein Lal_00001329 [Lupinus albus]|nr:hypothetical protein Lal_00001329 [Lupinus albus]